MIVTKKCCVCNFEKDLKLFHKNKNTPDGLTGACSECINTRNKKRNSNKILEYNYDLDLTCKLCEKVKKSKLFPKDRNQKSGFSTVCKSCNSERVCNWRELNTEKQKVFKREYTSKRRSEDPLFKLSITSRSLIQQSFKRACQGKYRKSQKTEDILGCTIPEFIGHLESLFTEGMALENHGNCEECWHIDHKIPISSAKTEEEIIKLNHYTNLQPLWSRENISKGNKLI